MAVKMVLTRGRLMTLDQVKPGQRLLIKAILDEQARIQAIRFGISEGSRVTCTVVVAGGPVVVRHRHQEVALGRKLAARIQVSLDTRAVQDMM